MDKARSEHGCVKVAKTSQRKNQIHVVGGSSSDYAIESLQIGHKRWKVVGRTDPEENLKIHALRESCSSNYIAYSMGG